MIHVILGTKAQLIKMAPVMKALQSRNIPYRFIHTGQHKDTMAEMYEDFDLRKPDIYLYQGQDITSVAQIAAWSMRILAKGATGKREIFTVEDAGVVLVHGDTFSTLIGAMLGRFAGLQVAHVESGLRSYRLFHPFPEEITRILVFRLSHILYCPGEWAAGNVSKLNKRIVNTKGNTLLDTIRMSKEKKRLTVELPSHPFGLVSLHRYENIFKKDQLQKIVALLSSVAQDHQLIFILHAPTKKQLEKFGLLQQLQENENIKCSDRLSHSNFLQTLLKARFVITDGGSLQEETSYLDIPCLLFREATERQEGLGNNVVLSQFNDEIVKGFFENIEKFNRGDNEKETISPTELIVDDLENSFC